MITQDIQKPSAKALLDAKIESALKEFQISTGQKVHLVEVQCIPILNADDRFRIQVECT